MSILNKFKQQLGAIKAKYVPPKWEPQVDSQLKQRLTERGHTEQQINQMFGINQPKQGFIKSVGGTADERTITDQTPVNVMRIVDGKFVDEGSISNQEYQQRISEPTSEPSPQPSANVSNEPPAVAQPVVSEQKPLDKGVNFSVKLPDYVPDEFKGYIIEASEENGVDPKVLSAILKGENQGWDSNMKNPQENSTALGLPQMTVGTRNYMKPFFEKKYGRSFDFKNPQDQIKLAALYIDRIKQLHPSRKDDVDWIIGRYNIGHNSTKENDDYVNYIKRFLK